MNGPRFLSSQSLSDRQILPFQKTERLIINIGSIDPSVIVNYHLDWLEFGVWCDFVAVEYILAEIKKCLSSITFQEAYGNQHYFQSLRATDYGITVFHDLRPKLKNCALTIRLAGTFFRYGFSHSFVNELLRFFHGLEISLSPVRVDSAVDFISMSELFIPVPECLPLPGNPKWKKDLFYGRINDRQLSIIRTFPYSGDSLLRVYDKLLDEKDPHFLQRHPEYKGALSVWRLEFEFKGDTLRATYINDGSTWSDYDTLYRHVLGQCFRRYSFQGFTFPASTISSYIKTDTDDLHRYNDAINKMRTNYNRALQLEKRLFCERPNLDADSMSVFDLMSEHEENSKEMGF